MKRIALVVAVIVTIGFGIYLLNFTSQEKDVIQQPVPQNQTPSQQQVTLPSTIYNLTGTVRVVQQDSLIFEAKIPGIASDGSLVYQLENKTVGVTPDTRITKLIFVQDAETNQRKLQELDISLSSLVRGDVIEVISKREIRDTDEIFATQIRLLP